VTLPPLRPYQADAYARLRAAAHAWRPRKPGYGLLAVAPTGAGKTRLALELATVAIAKGREVLWLAPRTELIDQPVERLRACGWTDIRIMQGARTGGDGPITVASIQTLVARGEAPPADLVILDEARHYVAAEWGEIAGQYLDTVRVGLDATPARADGAPLGDLFDELVEVATIGGLTSAGWLIPARIIAPDECTKDLAWEPVEWWHEWASDRATLVFCAGQKHARDMAVSFVAAGVSAMAVDAHTPPELRQLAVDMLRAGELQVLCNVGVFTEGFDAPGLGCIMVCRGVSNEWTWLQMLGRGLRPAGGRAAPGEHCLVGDFRGWCHKHGWPSDERTWHLEGKPLSRAEALPACVQCPACHGWSRGGGPCPTCGAEKPPPPPPKVSKREMAERRREHMRRTVPRAGPKWEHFAALVRTARARGWKPNAVSLRFRARYRHWPVWAAEQVEG